MDAAQGGRRESGHHTRLLEEDSNDLKLQLLAPLKGLVRLDLKVMLKRGELSGNFSR
jgi:hypothetical protein